MPDFDRLPDLDRLTAVLMDEFSRSGISELDLRRGDFGIYLSKSGRKRTAQPPISAQAAIPTIAAPEKRSASSAAPAARLTTPIADLPAGAQIVTAPNLGTFYRAPKPGSAPYVEIGGAVGIGNELCLIEVMKLFTAVRADTAGRLHAVLAEDGSMVEAGQPLFALVSE